MAGVGGSWRQQQGDQVLRVLEQRVEPVIHFHDSPPATAQPTNPTSAWHVCAATHGFRDFADCPTKLLCPRDWQQPLDVGAPAGVGGHLQAVAHRFNQQTQHREADAASALGVGEGKWQPSIRSAQALSLMTSTTKT
jgi:hypothetical protein